MEHYGTVGTNDAQVMMTDSGSCNADHAMSSSSSSTSKAATDGFVPQLVCNTLLWSFTFPNGVIDVEVEATEATVKSTTTNFTINSTTTTNSITTQRSKQLYTYQIGIDFDEASLLNSFCTDDELNVIQQMPDGTNAYDYFGDKSSVLLASRDIVEGEELRQDYGDMVDPDGWDYVGLEW